MHETLIKLNATGASTPCTMTRPEGFHSITRIQYDVRTTAAGDPRLQEITFRHPQDFLTLTARRTASDSQVETMALGASGYNIQIRNDQAPQWWTILEGYDDIIFDSYDSTIETNLQNSKSLANGVKRPTLGLTDAAVPDLPQNLMQLLKNRARAFYFDVYKDGTTKEVDKRQRNSEVRSQRMKYITKQLQEERTGPNFGRRGHRTARPTNRQ